MISVDFRCTSCNGCSTTSKFSDTPFSRVRVEAVELGLEAGVKTLVLFHHAPNNDDSSLDIMDREATNVATGSSTRVVMARDNIVLNVPDK